MTSPTNWPHTGGDPELYLRHQEKRLANEQRRPMVSRASDILGPGFAPYATKITDWGGNLSTDYAGGGDEAAFNGYFWSEPSSSSNAPDITSTWMGWTFSTGLSGLQKVWNADGVGYQRRWNVVSGVRVYSAWISESGPYVELRASAATSIGDGGAAVQINLNTTVHCDTEFFSVGLNGFVNILQDGRYDLSGWAGFNVGAGPGFRIVGFFTAAGYLNRTVGQSISYWYAAPSAQGEVLLAGSYVQLVGAQTSGASMNTVHTGPEVSRLHIRKVG